MKINGYKLQHALRELAHARDIAASQFSDSLKAFPGDDKPLPADVMAAYTAAEAKIAKIQTAQGRYNLAVQVEAAGVFMTLSEAVKLVGGAGRSEKMWRSAAIIEKDRYGRADDLRDPTQIASKRTISLIDAAGKAKAAAKWASALREAIQVGNATDLELDVELSDLE